MSQAGCQALGGDLLVSKSRSGYCFYGNYNLVREDRFQFKIYTYILFYTILNAAKKSTIDMLLGNIIL